LKPNLKTRSKKGGPFFLVHYVEKCSPKIKLFKTNRELESFLSSFKKIVEDDDEDNCIDFIIKGLEFKSIDPYYLSFLEIDT